MSVTYEDTHTLCPVISSSSSSTGTIVLSFKIVCTLCRYLVLPLNRFSWTLDTVAQTDIGVAKGDPIFF